MAENSAIEWTDATFNPWWGCRRISPACDHCYADTWARRLGLQLWDNGKYRMFGAKHWAEPLKWNKRAEREGRRLRVFCASMADVFDKDGPASERQNLWDLVEDTPHLDWLLLTKRVGNVLRMVPDDWLGEFPPNVWLGISVVNQEEADRDIPKLLAIPAAVRFLSCEPLLGPITFDHDWLESEYFGHTANCDDDLCALNADAHSCAGQVFPKPAIDWVICGGESGPDARPMHPNLARSLRDQCVEAHVPFLFKQWGEWAPGECALSLPTRTERTATWSCGEWLFGRQSPSEECHRDDEPDLFRLGKKAAGRHLDGRTWDEFPQTH